MTKPKHHTKKAPTQAHEITDSSAQAILELIIRNAISADGRKHQRLKHYMPTGVALERCLATLHKAEAEVLAHAARQLREKNAEIYALITIATAKAKP